MLPEIIIYHNRLEEWLIGIGIAVLIFLSVLAAKRVIHKKLSAFAANTVTIWDDLLAELIGRLNIVFILGLAVFFGSLRVALPDATDAILRHAVGIVTLFQIAILSSHAVSFWVGRFRKQKLESNAGAVTTLTSVGFVLRMLIWLILLLIGLDNLGINITTLIAGLGISGIAVALAIQNILSDLFASFSIVLDKPFVIGDFIIIDDYMGSVEHVGLKTTRIRSLSGEQLIFSNAHLLKSRIPDMIRNAVEKNSNVRFDRAHFKAFGDFALQFEVVYWIQNPDYNVYMDIQQAINLDIMKQFDEAGISFAYPTQTILMQPTDNPS